MYSVLTPLLPRLVDRFDLTKSVAGVLYSAYMVGSVAGALAAGPILTSVGRRRATRTALVVIAVTLVGFASSTSIEAALVFRFVGGIAGGLAWVATLTWLLGVGSSDKRGSLVGSVMSVSVFGTLIGPLIGSAAAGVGNLPVFALVAAVSLVCAVLLPADDASPAALVAGPRAEGPGLLALAGSTWILSLMAFTYGALFVLLPLRLDQTGMSEVAIGWLFAGSSALSALVTRAAGKATDKVGTFLLTSVSVVGGAGILLVLAIDGGLWFEAVTAVLATGVVYALGIAPNSTAVSIDADRLGLPLHTTSMILLLSFSGGESIGGIVTPIGADLSSDAEALRMLAAVTLLSLGAVLVQRRRKSAVPPAAAPISASTGIESH